MCGRWSLKANFGCASKLAFKVHVVLVMHMYNVNLIYVSTKHSS